MKARNFNVWRAGVKWFASFELDASAVKNAQDCVDRFRDTEINVDVQKYREKRSLTANAYFHVLVNKLATTLNTSNEEMKRWLVRQYGTTAEVEGKSVEIRLPKGANPLDFYEYCVFVGSIDGYDHYLLMKQTHVMNTAEMSKLIDGTISECKALGIETLSDDELERLYAQTDKGNGNTERRQKTRI